MAFDSWFSALDNLKLINSYGWTWLTRLKRNRLVNPDCQGNRPISEVEISDTGTMVHLKGYGSILVFKIGAPDEVAKVRDTGSRTLATVGDIDFWATNNLHMNHLQRLQWAEYEWSIEEYHRGLKQCCGINKCFVRSDGAQRNHIGLSIRAFLRLEIHWFNTGISWYESKLLSVRDAVRSYLAAPSIAFSPTA